MKNSQFFATLQKYQIRLAPKWQVKNTKNNMFKVQKKGSINFYATLFSSPLVGVNVLNIFKHILSQNIKIKDNLFVFSFLVMFLPVILFLRYKGLLRDTTITFPLPITQL